MNAFLVFFSIVQILVMKKVLDGGEKVLFVVRLGDELICAALHRSDHILRIRKGGKQDDRGAHESFIYLDITAKFKTVHFGHDDVADDQIRSLIVQDRKRSSAVHG